MTCGRFRTAVDSDGREFVGNCEATDDCGFIASGIEKDFEFDKKKRFLWTFGEL